MSAVYILEQGAVVRRRDQHLEVFKGKERLAHLIPFNIDHMLLFGRVQITAEAMDLLLKEGIDVAYLTQNGRLRGRIVATESKNMLLRIAQYERNLNEPYKIELSRTIVKAKIRNSKAVMIQFRRNHPEVNFDDELDRLDAILRKLDGQTTVNSLMGSEGFSAAVYFRAFGKMFRQGLTFAARTRRPPKDPVNAVLSLGYTMLTNEIQSLLTAHGFDVYIGILHGLEYGRPSLALDLVEEFRQPIIDRLTLHLFNNRIFTDKDFRPVEGEGIYLEKEALNTFFKAYEQRMKETFQYQNESTNFRKILRKQVQILDNTIQFNQPYIPFKLRE